MLRQPSPGTSLLAQRFAQLVGKRAHARRRCCRLPRFVFAQLRLLALVNDGLLAEPDAPPGIARVVLVRCLPLEDAARETSAARSWEKESEEKRLPTCMGLPAAAPTSYA